MHDIPKLRQVNGKSLLKTCVSQARNTEFGGKVADTFPTLAAMKGDKDFSKALRLLGKTCKICNMHVERCLSRIGRSVAHLHGAPEIERIRASGFLSEVLTDHKQHGGEDPRFQTSQQLIDQGVPLLRAKKKIKRPGKQAGAFAMFCAAQQRERSAAGFH